MRVSGSVVIRPAGWAMMVFFAAAVAWAQTPSIAVIDFEPRGIAEHEAAIIAERFRGHLVRSGVYKVMERGQMEAVLKEQGFQHSGACTDASCVVEMGQLLAVGKIVTGSVGKIGGMYTVDIKVIAIKTGQIVMTVSEDVRGSVEDVLLSAVPKIAEKVIAEETSAGLTVGYIDVTSEPVGATVLVDGKTAGTTPVRGFEVPVGKHTVSVSTEGFVGQERTITTVKGKTESIELTLSPTSETLAARQEEAGAKRETFGKVLRWSGVAVAAVGLGATTYFWLNADSKYDEYSSSTDSDGAAALWDETESSATYGNVSAIVGGVGLVALGVSFAF